MSQVVEKSIMTNPAFLLQTDNNEPLVEFIEKLTYKVDNNEKVIKEVVEKFDSLKFPQELQGSKHNSSHSTNKNGDEHKIAENYRGEEDELRHHLDSKYQLQKMGYPKEFDEVQNGWVKQLLIDNYKLIKIKQSKRITNYKLLTILDDYRNFINKDLLPSIRKDFKALVDQETGNFDRVLKYKLSVNEKVWSEYNSYLNTLQRIFELLHSLLTLLDSLDSDVMQNLEMKLSALEDLIKKVKGKEIMSFQID